MPQANSPTATLSIAALRAEFDGLVIAPGDDLYDAARTVFVGGFDLHPAVIVRPTSSAEVAKVVSIAKETGLELAIRSGGHSGSAHSSVEGGILLDLTNMKSLDIDVEARTAWAETGLTAGEVTAAVGEQGLVIGFGDTGSVGIGGITLGGGMGFVSRKYGMTIDNVLAAEIVTADGNVLIADHDHHADLFWAVRGGGGNFGVVTRFKFQLHELPQVYGGMLMLPATPEVVAGTVAAADTAPDELSTIINVMSAPPMPFIPAELHGKIIVMALLCYAGDPEAGEKAIAPFRGLTTALVDTVQAIPYSGMFQGGPGGDDYHPTTVSTTTFHDKIDLGDAETILRYLNDSDAPMRAVQIRVLGGAIARVPADATSYAHRDAKIMTNFASFYVGPDDKPRRQQWLRELYSALDQGHESAYVNFINTDGDTAARAAYPAATYDRLATVKARYDAENLFRRNINIAPA